MHSIIPFELSIKQCHPLRPFIVCWNLLFTPKLYRFYGNEKMQRLIEGRARNEPWACSRCNRFKAITLRILLSHYNNTHANEPNFRVVCGIDKCPSQFSVYNSFYKHVLTHHKELYDDNRMEINESRQGEQENDHQTESSDDDCHSDVDGDLHLDEGNSDDFEDEEEQGLQEKDDKVDIQKSAASFLLKVKERNKIPQVAMESIIDSTRTLVRQVVNNVKSDVLKALQANEQNEIVENLFNYVPDPFAGIETEALQSKYIREHFNHVAYQEIALGKILSRKKKGSKRIICEKEEKFIYIPILKSLQQLLLNERISTMVLKKPTSCSDGVYYDIHDGNFYRSDQYFRDHENAMSLIIYHDELEVCNPLGSNANTHKVDMFYYTVSNLCPKIRSKRCAIRLLAIANASLVKKYGIDAIMKPILADLQLLHNGYSMEINGQPGIVYGKVSMCTGDTLGQHYWGGFKEGVGVAFQKCRHCLCEFQQMQTDFVEERFSLRTKENYAMQCNEIEQAPTEAMKKDLQTTYGINSKSPLCQLPTFDVTKQLPQDIMHTLLEGTVQYEVRLVLQHYIQAGVTSLPQINGAISSHEYGYSEVSDKPGPLKESVFFGDERYKLKYKAAQARLFLRVLPFIIGPLVNTEDPYYKFLVELIQIVQLIFSPVISLASVHYLKQLIAEHLCNFKELFPNANILPKQHYLLHIPSTIQMFGPMVRSSCFSFESAHRYFKDLARKQNFKNLPLSLAKRHQFNECCNFGDPNEPPSSHPLFSSEKSCGVLKKLEMESCQTLREMFSTLGLLPGVKFVHVYRASWIKLYGTKYSKSGVIAVGTEGDPALPVFGIISDIWLFGDFTYFGVLLLHTVCFDYIHQAYQVTEPSNEEESVHACAYESLLDYNVSHVKKDQHGNKYVSVKYDLDDLIEENIQGKNPLNM